MGKCHDGPQNPNAGPDAGTPACGTVQPCPCSGAHAKIDLAGVADANKATIGGLIVRNFDGNNAPRKKITVSMRVLPAGCNTNVILQSASNKVKIYDAATAGTQIAIDGTHNRFPVGSLPKDFWVKGVEASATMRDVEISVDVESVAVRDDFVKLTVLWLDKPTVALSNTDTVSANNDKRDPYKNWTSAGSYNLGLQRYNNNWGERMGWGSEARAGVHPAGFNYPGNDLKLERDADHKYFNGSTVISQRGHNATMPPANDTGPAGARDDSPAPNDTIYDWDAAGLPIPSLAANTIYRIRVNMKAFASVTAEGQSVRCSEVRDYFIRFSQKQFTVPSGTDWRVIDPPDIPNDKQAANGITSLTWDLN